MSEPRTCDWCGASPPVGHASISIGGEVQWYCHPDDDAVSCYMRAGWAVALTTNVVDLPPL